ncbi:MAG: Gfo/Idh/MocA family oxidoreductase [Rhodospirillales bacterium]|nr:Gfo/Idh/MocA family oxidoreductase [Rhodospirillales bacterium]
MSERLRAIVLGCGRIAGGLNRSSDDAMVLTHALAYRRNPRFTLVACIETDAHVRADFAARWALESAYVSLDEAFANGAVYDVASVCVPTAAHVATLDRLLDMPVRAVFAEKPLGGDPAAARRIVERFRRAGKPLAVAYLRRWDPAMMALRAEIAEGRWGAWRGGAAFYGRGVVNNGSHAIDLLRFLTGEEFRIAATAGARADGVPDDPSIDAILEAGGGQRVHLVACDGRDYAFFEMTLAFAHGIVAIEDGGLRVVRRAVAASEHFFGVDVPGAGYGASTGYGDAFVHALDDIAGCLEHGGEPKSSGASALASIELACALRAAATEAESIK